MRTITKEEYLQQLNEKIRTEVEASRSALKEAELSTDYNRAVKSVEAFGHSLRAAGFIMEREVRIFNRKVHDSFIVSG